MRWNGHLRLRLRLALCLLTHVVLASTGCYRKMTGSTSSSPKRDINAVLADHDKSLLAIPGVVGIYVGLLDDGETPCLRVMLARKTPEQKRAIPDNLEGHPVVTEVTGEIRPLGTP